MSMVISSLACVALLAISLAHFMWAFGRPWPIQNRRLLARTVIGTPDVDKMPPWYALLALAILTFVAAVLVLALADPDGGGAWLTAIGAVIGLVFLGRGIAGYVPAWQLKTPEEPFRTNDFRVYSPMCLLLGAGFLALVIMRLL
ncbi:MAG TPA: DUF3995 domain-containing protein [Devosiaceae bacterium]|jgi:multisubunit Na+/H+ antiporter MnhB subunit